MKDDDEFEGNFIKPELSIEECRSILCRDGDEYTDEEIVEIRSLMITLIEIDFYYFKSEQRKKAETNQVIEIKQNDQTNPHRKAG